MPPPSQEYQDAHGWKDGKPPPGGNGKDADDGQQDARAKAAQFLAITDDPWNPETLPPRPWLAAPYLMRGEITLPHGPGGGGKSQLAIAWAGALALGRPFGRLQPKQRCRALLTNFEDSSIEQMRRITAALEYFGACPSDLHGWLYRVSVGPNGDATMFDINEHGAAAGHTSSLEGTGVRCVKDCSSRVGMKHSTDGTSGAALPT